MNIIVSTALVLALSMTLVSASDESTVSKTSEKILAEIMRILKDDGILEAETVEEPVEAAQDVTNLDLEVELMEQPSSVKSAAEEDVAEEAAADQPPARPPSQEALTSREAVIAEIMRLLKADESKGEVQSEEPGEILQADKEDVNLEAEAMEQPSSVKSAAEEDVAEEAAADPSQEVSTSRDAVIAEIMRIIGEEAKAKAMKASARPQEPLEAAGLNAKSSESLTSSQEELQQAGLPESNAGLPASSEKVSTARNENLAAIMEIFKEEELVLAKQMEYLNALLSTSVRVRRAPPMVG